MKYFYCFLCLTLLLCISGPAHAAITLGNLVANQINELEDDDFEMLINVGGTIVAPGSDTVVGAGDYLAAIIRITALRVPIGGLQIATATDTQATFTAVSLFRVSSVATGAGGVVDGSLDVTFRFAAPTAAEWSTVLDIGGAGAALAYLVPSNNNTGVVVFEDPSNMNQTLGSAVADFATVNGVKAWEFGFTGAAGEFFITNTDTADLSTAFSMVTGQFTAAMNVTGYFAGPQLTSFVRPGGVVSADVHFVNGSVGSVAPGANPPFPVSSDVDVLIRPVPEPGAMLVWAGLMVAGCVGAARWRRKATS